jgi:hypothetical protein
MAAAAAADRSFMRRRVFMPRGKTVCLAIASVITAYSASGGTFSRAQLVVSHAQNAVADAIAGPQFTDAAFSLDRYHTLSGTYDGAAVEGRLITVRWATATSYCIEGVSEAGSAQYLLGPYGHVASGNCPIAF